MTPGSRSDGPRCTSSPTPCALEARLEGGAAHLDHVIELVKAGLMSAMSIGFTVGSRRSVEQRTEPRRAAASAAPRRQAPRCQSLVTRPAYAAAQVETLRHRTALQAWSDDRDARIPSAQSAQEEAEARARPSRIQAELDAWLAVEHARQAELEATFARHRPAAQSPPSPAPGSRTAAN